MAGEQQLLPLQAQEEQQRIQAQQLENQKAQLALQSQKAMMAAWADPDFASSVTGEAPEGSVSAGTGFDASKMIRSLVSRGVQPDQAINVAAGFLDMSKNAAAMTKDQLSNYKDSHDQLFNLLAPIADLPPAGQVQALAVLKQKLAASPLPGLDPLDANLVQNADPEHLPAMLGLMGFTGKLLDYRKSQAEEQEAESRKVRAQQESDPLFALENDPSQMTGDKAPAAIAMLQGKLTDLNTKPEDLPRIQRLLGQAQQAQQNSLNFDAAKERAQQAITEGDPKAAAQLLVSGMVAPSELVSSRRPAFAQQAFSEAQKLDPNWNAQKADADFNVAKSPVAQQFFGSANSLITKGGTLDQLATQAQLLPAMKFPKLNTVADYLSYNWGDPSTAAYAATALGVADDYSKVMGGGTGSDTARLQVLHSLSAAQNPQQRAAVLQNIRNAVTSQRDSRIGNNPVMRQMYSGAGSVETKANSPTPKTHSFSLSAWKTANPNGDVNAARVAAEAAGYEVRQ